MDSIGDIRVRYFTHKIALDAMKEGKALVSMIGKQKGDTIDSEDEMFVMKLNEDYSVQDFIEEAKKPIKENNIKLRTLIFLCTGIFIYCVLVHEKVNFKIEIPDLFFQAKTD